MRIFCEVRQRVAKSSDRRGEEGAIRLGTTRQRQSMRRVARAPYQLQIEATLDDAARLPHAAAVHAHEVGSLAGKRSEVGFAGGYEAVKDRGKLVKIALHRSGRHHGFARGHQSSPPNTSTF